MKTRTIKVDMRPDYANMFRKIQEAACAGLDGSPSYALDRLALIQALATTALQRLEE